ncbi:MAG: hypoxanthine phosphoribosyltransferase [Gemmatimonadetes bacterium]|uniref:Hypoxanthine phosphoribosyltransferase n=1 Tax=Candidatus Kutchimonas denitrificans TaxID=3056748 RepID=A0AAE5C8I2_9BACT|nr:hypoxanthine phosphoribosyltransferase [Gemmatimonadota bacterium]NIR74506.1 hypoxanthine phosphoribosyltransferase [Candidatus Kutchimonas denitrificans]NIS02696.1 hypoxanthine phosphoribosyltransferase [Gemmatimonadota bacterium]NIT68857.1 hypoxanthine phosphoribosyltransferase [Gemmatimonadota bacterium]NIU52162.1 hypoxanthine phosphoribosyltransferase [Gemmatimonadota bacterium]
MSELATRYPDLERVVFSQEQIAARVEELGREIDSFYGPEDELLVVGLLKGAFVFTSDLVRQLEGRAVTVDFLTAALYGHGTDSSREVRLHQDLTASVEERHVLLIEDIVDSGKTLNRIGDLLAARKPRSLEVCAFLHKRIADGLRYEPRWVGFDAPPDWLVGYGLDLGERYRHLPFVGAIATGEE